MKKKIFYLLLISITFFIIYITLTPQYNNTSKTEDISPFKISKILFYSGIIPKSTSFSNSNNWNLEISQYTDIAIYISNSGELTDYNTVKSLYIDNIKYIKKPNKGTPSLYYQNPLKFATSSIYSDYVIDNHLNYNILNFDNTDNFNYYSTPNFFVDCSNPIVLKYVNSGVMKNYNFSNKNKLVFNGSILKNSNISLEDLNSQISFTINIVSNNQKLYKYDMNINIPLSNSESTLLEENIYLEIENNSPFNEISKQ